MEKTKLILKCPKCHSKNIGCESNNGKTLFYYCKDCGKKNKTWKCFLFFKKMTKEEIENTENRLKFKKIANNDYKNNKEKEKDIKHLTEIMQGAINNRYICNCFIDN